MSRGSTLSRAALRGRFLPATKQEKAIAQLEGAIRLLSRTLLDIRGYIENNPDKASIEQVKDMATQTLLGLGLTFETKPKEQTDVGNSETAG